MLFPHRAAGLFLCRDWCCFHIGLQGSVGPLGFSVCLLQTIERRQACIPGLFPKIMSHSHPSVKQRSLFGVPFLYVNLRIKPGSKTELDVCCTYWVRPSQGQALSCWSLDIPRPAKPHSQCPEGGEALSVGASRADNPEEETKGLHLELDPVGKSPWPV